MLRWHQNSYFMFISLFLIQNKFSETNEHKNRFKLIHTMHSYCIFVISNRIT